MRRGGEQKAEVRGGRRGQGRGQMGRRQDRGWEGECLGEGKLESWPRDLGQKTAPVSQFSWDTDSYHVDRRLCVWTHRTGARYRSFPSSLPLQSHGSRGLALQWLPSFKSFLGAQTKAHGPQLWQHRSRDLGGGFDPHRVGGWRTPQSLPGETGPQKSY